MHVSEIISKVVQTATQAPTTMGERVIPDWLKDQFKLFQTLKDPVLEQMLTAAMHWGLDLYSDRHPRWISFVGKSGTGKTFLGNMCKDLARKHPGLMYHNSLISPIFMRHWPKLLEKLRDKEYWRIGECLDANVLFLDELALEHDPSGFGADKMCQILSGRVGKWTIITSNLGMEKIEAIDTRIASRMVRDGSVVVECNTVDYAMR